jgi:hypothetical protein
MFVTKFGHPYTLLGGDEVGAVGEVRMCTPCSFAALQPWATSESAALLNLISCPMVYKLQRKVQNTVLDL